MEHNCIPDEHYVQTLLTHKGLEGEITRRSLTHSSWDLSSSRDPQRRGWHPMTYKLADATPNLIQSIKVPASESQYDDNYYPMDDKYNGLFHSQTGTQSSETQRSCQRLPAWLESTNFVSQPFVLISVHPGSAKCQRTERCRMGERGILQPANA